MSVVRKTRPAPLPLDDEADVELMDRGPRGSQAMVVLMMGLAGLCVLAAMTEPAPRGAVWAGLACCAGIFARIAQAERHHG